MLLTVIIEMSLRDIEVISTRRGGIALLFEGRKYHRKKQYTNGNTIFLCANYNDGSGESVVLNQKNEVDRDKIKTHNADCI